MLMIDVVTGPKVLAEHPTEDHLGKSTPFEGHLIKQFRATLLTEVTVPEHG